MRKPMLIALGAVAALAASAALAMLAGSRAAPGACTEPAPAGAFATYRATAADGNCLQGYVWSSTGAPVRAVLVVVHGIHDHARRYGDLAQALNAAGIAVVAQDHRGHAASGGARQRIDSVAQVQADVALALDEAARRYPGLPLFLYGHSMGGMVAAHQAAAPMRPLAGVIVSSAALQLPPSAGALQLGVVKLLSALAPGLGLEAIDDTKMLRDPAARQVLATDPSIEAGKVPARTVAMVLSGIQGIDGRMAAIRVPLLVLHGSDDQVTEVAGSRALAARAATADKTLLLVPGARHDLLHEPERGLVTAQIVGFVSGRLPPAQR